MPCWAVVRMSIAGNVNCHIHTVTISQTCNAKYFNRSYSASFKLLNLFFLQNRFYGGVLGLPRDPDQQKHA